MKRFFYLIPVLALLACKKRELPVPKHQQGNINKVSIPMTSSYKYQIYFSLKNNAIMKQQLKTLWDICFHCKSKKIILNSSKMMFAMKTNFTNFSDVTDSTGFQQGKRYDSPTGNLDSTAIGNWENDNKVYIIDRGFNENGQHLGFKKLKIVSFNNQTFTFSVADLNDSQGQTFQVLQDTNYNFIGFSFQDNQIKIIEPPKTEWDIVFTQYTERLSQPYLVLGCLLNRYNTYATVTKQVTFESLNYNTALNYSLSSNINIIGYNWKEYDFNSSSYIVFSNFTYIIRDSENYYYKLRFIDFYNSNGEKGYPTFEFQRL